MDKTQLLIELHKIFRKKLQCLNNQTDNRQILSILNEYLDSMASLFVSFGESSIQQPYKEMALIIRILQAFYTSDFTSLYLLKLVKEYSYDKDPLSVSSLLKRGELEMLPHVLSKQHDKKSHIKYIESCASLSSRVFGHPYGTSNKNEFNQRFEEIQKESQKMLQYLEKVESPLVNIAKVISGDLNAFMGLQPTWIEFLLLNLLFVEGVPRNIKLISLMIQERGFEINEIDRLLLNLISAENPHIVVQVCSERFPMYFVAHLAEVLEIIMGLPNTPVPQFGGLKYVDFYFSKMIQESMNDLDLPFYLLGDYILYTMDHPEECMKTIKEIISVRKDYTDPHEVVDYLNKLGLGELLENYVQELVDECLKNNKFAEALMWPISSGYTDMQEISEDAVLRHALKSDTSQIELLLGEFDDALKANTLSLVFLKNFVLYEKSVQNGDFENAIPHFMNFIIRKTAPPMFYWRIFENIMTKSCEIRIPLEEFACVMKAFESSVKDKDPSIVQHVRKRLGEESVKSLLIQHHKPTGHK